MNKCHIKTSPKQKTIDKAAISVVGFGIVGLIVIGLVNPDAGVSEKERQGDTQIRKIQVDDRVITCIAIDNVGVTCDY